MWVPVERYLLRAKDFADAHYREPIDVDDMARVGRPVARALQP